MRLVVTALNYELMENPYCLTLECHSQGKDLKIFSCQPCLG